VQQVFDGIGSDWTTYVDRRGACMNRSANMSPHVTATRLRAVNWMRRPLPSNLPARDCIAVIRCLARHARDRRGRRTHSSYRKTPRRV